MLSWLFGVNGVFMVVSTGRETPSVAGIINPGGDGFQKLFFGQEEIAIPVHSTYDMFLAFCLYVILFFSLFKFGLRIGNL
jgi:hypothetical protein